MVKLIKINPKDNVAVALEPLTAGEVDIVDGDTLTILKDVIAGHKVALKDIKKGESVVKYGYPIGRAQEDIKKGEWVHTFNIKTALSEEAEYHYDEETAKKNLKEFEDTVKQRVSDGSPCIKAYERKNGDIGIRNGLWIVPTVGCVNEISKKLAQWGNENLHLEDGVHAWTHPFGCSQLGDDHENTRKILSNLVHHPNAGGVLVVGLGCENNTMDSFRELVGEVDESRVKFMVCQKEKDELKRGKELLEEIASAMRDDKRTVVSASRLVVGMKCGGSDGLSGITANPLVGRFTDALVSIGGTAILTEVPEMFGAEQLLMNRCTTKAVFDRAVRLINNYKNYFLDHRQPVSENPSPGNKAGGITTLEEKSLGCVQKGGTAPITDVLDYGDRVTEPGLSLLGGPGNDMVAVTNLCAAGCQLILFTTGRGTPLGAPVPTVKIATNTALAKKKSGWIDLDAQTATTDDLFNLILRTANGQETQNERHGYREIAIFKDGVTL